MKSFNDILSKFENLDLTYLSKECKKQATQWNDYRLSQEDWEAVDDILEAIWKSNLSTNDKLNLGFDYFEMFPSYWALLPYYKYYIEGRLLKKQKTELLTILYSFLLAEDEYKKPAAYIIWVEFLEDSRTCEEVWNFLLKLCEEGQNERILLRLCGQVPWEIKVPLFKRLIPFEDYHESILRALVLCKVEPYGQLNIKEAKEIINQLKVSTTSEEYKVIEKAIADWIE